MTRLGSEKAEKFQSQMLEMFSGVKDKKDLLDKAGLSHQTVFHWRQAKKGCSISSALSLLNAMGYTIKIVKEEHSELQ